MNSKRFRLVLVGIFLLLCVGFIGTAYMGLSMLSAKSNQMVDLKIKNKTAEAQLDNLQASKNDIAKYGFFQSVANSVIPNDKDQAQAVLEIYQIAQQSGIAIQSITFPSSSLGGKAQAASPSSTSVSLSGPTPTPTSTGISQASPVSGVPGLYSLQLTITPQTGTNVPASQQVTYAKMLDFLKRIENNRRTAQISQVVIQPSSGQINFSLGLNIFIKP